MDEIERKEPRNLIERWKDDPAPLLARAVPNALCLMLATSMIFGFAWGIKYGASGEQALMIAIFGVSVLAVSLNPFIFLANYSINEEIREANRQTDSKLAQERANEDRRSKRDAATLRVIRLRLIEWAVTHGQVDKIDGLAENLLADLAAHKGEIRAQQRRPELTRVTHSSLPG